MVLGIGGLLAVTYGAAIAGSEWGWGTLKAAVARGESRIRYTLANYGVGRDLHAGSASSPRSSSGVVISALGAALSGIGLSGMGDRDALLGLPELFGRAGLAMAMNAALGFAIATVARSQLAGIGVGIGAVLRRGDRRRSSRRPDQVVPVRGLERARLGRQRVGGGGAAVGAARGTGGLARDAARPAARLVIVVARRLARRARSARAPSGSWTERAEIVPAEVRRRPRRGAWPASTQRAARRDRQAGRSAPTSPAATPGRPAGQLDLQAAPPGGDVDRRARPRPTRRRPPAAAGASRAGRSRPARSPSPARRRPAGATAALRPPSASATALRSTSASAGHDREREPPVDRDDDRLEHPGGVQAERRDRLQRIAAAALAQATRGRRAHIHAPYTRRPRGVPRRSRAFPVRPCGAFSRMLRPVRRSPPPPRPAWAPRRTTTDDHGAAAHAARTGDHDTPCALKSWACPPTCCGPSPTRATPSPRPSRNGRSPSSSQGRDVLAAAQTGTGKTAAFTLPILDRLKAQANTSFSPARHPVRCLVLTPTRELAVQVAESRSRPTAAGCPLRAAVVYGGVPLDPQIKELRAGVEILVATPGRLLDLVGQRAANLGQVEILVLDEADRMLDMGFMPDIQRILDLLPAASRRCCSRRRSRTTSSASPARSCATRSRSRSPATAPPPRPSASSSTRSTASARRSCCATS